MAIFIIKTEQNNIYKKKNKKSLNMKKIKFVWESR